MANATVQIPLSGSTQGLGIKVNATTTPGTLVHTSGTSATVLDQVWLFFYNGHTADVLVTIEFGGPAVPDQNIVLTIPFKQGLTLAVAGLPLLGSGSVASTVKVFAATTAVIVAYGYIFRITP